MLDWIRKWENLVQGVMALPAFAFGAAAIISGVSALALTLSSGGYCSDSRSGERFERVLDGERPVPVAAAANGDCVVTEVVSGAQTPLGEALGVQADGRLTPRPYIGWEQPTDAVLAGWLMQRLAPVLLAIASMNLQ